MIFYPRHLPTFFCTILEFHTQIHSHSTQKERKRVHNAFISLEYLVKIVRKLMQQMFECFDDFRQQKKAHIAHLCHRIPPCINTHTHSKMFHREKFVSFYSCTHCQLDIHFIKWEILKYIVVFIFGCV